MKSYEEFEKVAREYFVGCGKNGRKRPACFSDPFVFTFSEFILNLTGEDTIPLVTKDTVAAYERKVSRLESLASELSEETGVNIDVRLDEVREFIEMQGRVSNYTDRLGQAIENFYDELSSVFLLNLETLMEGHFTTLKMSGTDKQTGKEASLERAYAQYVKIEESLQELREKFGSLESCTVYTGPSLVSD